MRCLVLSALFALIFAARGVAVPSQEEFGWPRGNVVAIVPAKSSLLRDDRRALLEQAIGKRLYAETLWIQAWNKNGQALADAEAVDHVVLIRKAKTKNTNTRTHEYGTTEGRSARIKFTGAKSEVELTFLRRTEKWEPIGSWTSEKEAKAPYATSVRESGQREDVRIDPEEHLVRHLSDGVLHGVDYLAAEALWSQREHFGRVATGKDLRAQASLWMLANEVKGNGDLPFPKGSAAQAASSSWAWWQARWEAAQGDMDPGACGWCAESSVSRGPCPCPDASTFQALIELTETFVMRADGLRGVKIGERGQAAKGLRGDRPAKAFQHMAALQESLGELPALEVESIEATWPRNHWPKSESCVLLVADDAFGLLEGLHPDYALAARSLLLWRKPKPEQDVFRGWGFKKNIPFAGVLRFRPDNRSEATLKEHLPERDLEGARLEELFQLVLQNLFADG